MIPLRDENPTRTFPIVTILLIVANVIVFLIQKALDPVFDAEFCMIPYKLVTGQAGLMGILHATNAGALIFQPTTSLPPLQALGPNDILIAPSPIPPWATIFTAMFMHANLLHIGGNMLFLWIFGNNVEDAFGKVKFLIFYLGCGVVAALAQTALSIHSFIPTLGASGAIAGVLGAYIVMYPKAPVLTLIFVGFFGFLRDISAFWMLAIWIALQVIEEVVGMGGQATGGVAYMAHIGGFTTGVIVTLLFGGRALGLKTQIRSGQSNY